MLLPVLFVIADTFYLDWIKFRQRWLKTKSVTTASSSKNEGQSGGNGEVASRRAKINNKMPDGKVCVICGEYKRRSRKVSFFSIPKLDKNVQTKSDRELVERRIAAWMAAIGSNINKY